MIKNINSYINPFSSSFKVAARKFDNLPTPQKVFTIAMSVLVGLVTIPLLGIGGVATFRMCVKGFHSLKKGNDSTAQKTSQLTKPHLNAPGPPVKKVPQKWEILEPIDLKTINSNFNFNQPFDSSHITSKHLPNTDYLLIFDSPFDTWGFGGDFNGHPLYFNPPSDLARLTPINSILIVQGKDGKNYEVAVSKAINLQNVDDRVDHWVWVGLAAPTQQVIENEHAYLSTWWKNAIKLGMSGSLSLNLGKIKPMFPDFKGNPEQDVSLDIKIERESGNLYLEFDKKDPLYFAAPNNFIFEENEIKTFIETFVEFEMPFTIEVQKGNVNGKPMSFIVQGPTPKRDHNNDK